MPKFILEETVPCYVTFRRIITAPTVEAAWAAFDEGDGTPELGPMIGDAIDALPVTREAREA